jgi:ribonuclease-3 family protein
MWDDVFHHKPFVKPELAQPLVLAYIGDAVYELFIRQYLISLGNLKPHHLHRKASTYVSAKAQALTLRAIESTLTSEEMDIVKRGRNAKSGTIPKNTDVIIYRQSSGFEALIGYLFLLGKKERLNEVLDQTIRWAESQSNQEQSPSHHSQNEES